MERGPKDRKEEPREGVVDRKDRGLSRRGFLAGAGAALAGGAALMRSLEKKEELPDLRMIENAKDHYEALELSLQRAMDAFRGNTYSSYLTGETFKHLRADIISLEAAQEESMGSLEVALPDYFAGVRDYSASSPADEKERLIRVYAGMASDLRKIVSAETELTREIGELQESKFAVAVRSHAIEAMRGFLEQGSPERLVRP